MISLDRSQVERVERELANLERDAANLARKEADLLVKMNRARDTMYRTTSSSTLQSKSRELERDSKALADIKRKQSDISTKKVRSRKSLGDYQARLARAEEVERKRQDSRQRRLLKDLEDQQRQLTTSLREASLSQSISETDDTVKTYDFFISHASEDKEDFVRHLAQLLKEGGALVWYDEFELTVGKSLRTEIDRGLISSRFGIVVISEHFFAKDWPQRELNGLFALTTPSDSRILPIWHKITRDEVTRRSPILADIVALNTALQSTVKIAEALLKLVR